MLKLGPLPFTKQVNFYLLKKQCLLVFTRNNKKTFIDLKVNLVKTESGIKPISASNCVTKTLTTIYCVVLNQIWFGLFSGYRRQLNLVGIGYTVKIENNLLLFKLGYSHQVIVKLPNNILALCPKPRRLILKSFCLFELNTFAYIIQSLKKPNTYKRLGIYFRNQKVILKQGKKV